MKRIVTSSSRSGSINWWTGERSSSWSETYSLYNQRYKKTECIIIVFVIVVIIITTMIIIIVSSSNSNVTPRVCDTFVHPFIVSIILSTCLLYVGSLLRNLVWNDSGLEFDMMENNFFIVFIMLFIYLNAWENENTVFSFTLFSCLK